MSMRSDSTGNYFQLFGLPERFALTQSTLTERYRVLQQAVHPDRFASASDSERRQAVQQAAGVNEAYRVLKDPLSRARYMLELRGAAWDDERDTVVDPEFLMEQIELREALAAARETADPLAHVERVLSQVHDDIEHLDRALGQALDDEDGESLSRALTGVRRLQFLYKLRREAEALEAALEDEA